MSPERGANAASPRSGDAMPALDIDRLALLDEHRADAPVVRFAQLCERTTHAEKVSNPADWTPAERAAHESDDWKAFSRLRGYTADEIADFRAYLEAAADVATRYGINTACSIAYLVQHRIESA